VTGEVFQPFPVKNMHVVMAAKKNSFANVGVGHSRFAPLFRHIGKDMNA
jgi:hypothetical protein